MRPRRVDRLTPKCVQLHRNEQRLADQSRPSATPCRSEHRSFKRPLHSRRRGPLSLKRARTPKSARRPPYFSVTPTRGPFPGPIGGLPVGVHPDALSFVPMRSAAPPWLRVRGRSWWPVAACGGVCLEAGGAQPARCGTASRAGALCGNCGSSPTLVRIFAITGRFRMAAMAPNSLVGCQSPATADSLDRRQWTSADRHHRLG